MVDESIWTYKYCDDTTDKLSTVWFKITGIRFCKDLPKDYHFKDQLFCWLIFSIILRQYNIHIQNTKYINIRNKMLKNLRTFRKKGKKSSIYSQQSKFETFGLDWNIDFWFWCWFWTRIINNHKNPPPIIGKLKFPPLKNILS